MITEGSFNYFLNGKSKTIEDIRKSVNTEMAITIDGINVYYSLPKIKIENMNRLVEEELERQEQQVFKDWNTNSTSLIDKVTWANALNKDNLTDCKKQSKGVKCEKPNCISCNTVDFNNSDINVLQKIGLLNPITCDKYFTIDDKEEIGKKEKNGKTDYSEIDFDILDLMANRFNVNKHKYPHGNMLKPIEEKELLFALFRHLKKMIQPVHNDPETFEEHLAAILCNAQMVYQQRKLNKN